MDDHRELTAAYALDALDARERERYEAHLATCEECREELEALWAVSGALAHAAGGPAPRPALRERILQQARSERPNVVPLRRRFAFTPAAGIAVAAAALALGLGLWGTSLSRKLDDREGELDVLGDPNAQIFEAANGEANLVVTPTGAAALVVRRIAPDPDGKDYEIWVFENGVPHRAGLFERPGIAVLDRRVRAGQMVAVTVEPDGGLDAPTGAPIFTASTV
jgi:anti-sigma factor RsiW